MEDIQRTGRFEEDRDKEERKNERESGGGRMDRDRARKNQRFEETEKDARRGKRKRAIQK